MTTVPARKRRWGREKREGWRTVPSDFGAGGFERSVGRSSARAHAARPTRRVLKARGRCEGRTDERRNPWGANSTDFPGPDTRCPPLPLPPRQPPSPPLFLPAPPERDATPWCWRPQRSNPLFSPPAPHRRSLQPDASPRIQSAPATRPGPANAIPILRDQKNPPDRSDPTRLDAAAPHRRCEGPPLASPPSPPTPCPTTSNLSTANPPPNPNPSQSVLTSFLSSSNMSRTFWALVR